LEKHKTFKLGRRARQSAQGDHSVSDVHALIDWERIEGMLACIHANKKGAQAWLLLLMFKAMLLQSWYNLSDPKLGL
jgi:hypothetical protein